MMRITAAVHGTVVVVLALVLAACGSDGTQQDTVVDDQGTDEGAGTEEAAPTDADEVSDARGAEVNLTPGHAFPAQHLIHANVLEPLAQQVTDATGGTVGIELIPGGGLGPPEGTYENVVAGAQDLGWSLQGYTAGRFPSTQIIEAPFLFPPGRCRTT